MVIHAILLIQDIQLVCFTIVFGVLAFQRWSDQTRRWFWYSFLANTIGAVFDLSDGHLPFWITRVVNLEMIPLSYALINVALTHFTQHGKRARWLSYSLLLAALPIFVVWMNNPDRMASDVLVDLLIALECIVAVALLLSRPQQSTRAPRLLMSIFLVTFICVELARVWVVFSAHVDPDLSSSPLAVVCMVVYVMNVSLLPICFVWLMQSRSEWELLQQTRVDSLTGVLNRRGLEQALEQGLIFFRRFGEDMAVAMLDLDNFKLVNDKYGHAAGDNILKHVAQLLARNVRETDTVSRLGGDEFVLLFPRTTVEHAVPLLQYLCRTINASAAEFSPVGVSTTASVGVTSTNGRYACLASTLLDEADKALYQAKDSGRDRVRLFPLPESAEARQRRIWPSTPRLQRTADPEL